MKIEQFNDMHVVGSIHTISFQSGHILLKEQQKTVKRYLGTPRSANLGADAITAKYKMNPNHVNGEIRTLAEYQSALNQMQEETGINDVSLTRLDFRFDASNSDYRAFLKLNQCFVLLFALKHDVKNRYQSVDPLAMKDLTVKTGKSVCELEYYNKPRQEDTIGTARSGVKARLELRCMRASGRAPEEILDELSDRISNLNSYYGDLESHLNTGLMECWIDEGCSMKDSVRFVWKYQNSFISRHQLVEFAAWLGHNNPAKFADNCRDSIKMEFVSRNDIARYTAKLKAEIDRFIQLK